MRKTIVLTCLLTALAFTTFSQENDSDSLKTLEGILLRAFEQNRTPPNSTASLRVLTPTNEDLGDRTSLVSSFNTLPGVRMEERSPGSYRINIRGSSLRSPFGVRNVKVYWNDLPVTDPGGNTYFNQFAVNNFSSIEVFNGPAGSLYGAGTGGLIIINNFYPFERGLSLDYMAGSYGLRNILLRAGFGNQESKHQFTYAHNESDGYRAQSAMRRDNLTWSSRIMHSERNELTASFLFTDLEYQTPGALTLSEYNSNPKLARPAAGPFPSAEAVNASIYQKTLLAGFSNQYHINASLRNNTSLYGAFAQIKNSAVRNYERRNEPHFGGRTSFIYSKKSGNDSYQLVAGGEFQQGYFNTQVADNRNGSPDTLQTNDDVSLTSLGIFLQLDASFAERWFITAGASVNDSRVTFSRLSEYPVIKQGRKYRNEVAPRFSVLRKLNNGLSLLATVSRGFSPPTIAELLPSTGVISTELEAEKGMNYEMTIRYDWRAKKIYFEGTGFYFHLHDALVQRRDLSGADYFVNAGSVKQKGIELHASHTSFLPATSWFDHLYLRADFTYNHFRYGQFMKGSEDFTGNIVPSVPSNTLSLLARVNLKNGVYLGLTWYAASRIYLNDANTYTAEPYQLLGGRLGWKETWKRKYRTNLFLGADNLFDEIYSLGNDINAAANRYYNAAPGRNFYLGLTFQLVN